MKTKFYSIKIDKILLLLILFYLLILSIFFMSYLSIFKFDINYNKNNYDLLSENWTTNPYLQKKNNCTSFDKNKNNLLFIGDSHAMQLYMGGIKSDNLFYNNLLLSGSLLTGNWLDYELLNNRLNDIANLLDCASEGDVVVFSVAQMHWYVGGYRKINREEYLKYIINFFIKKTISMGLVLVLIDDNPVLYVDLPISVCIKQFNKYGHSDCDISKDAAIKKRVIYSNVLKEFIALSHNIKYFDSLFIVCPETVCTPQANGELVYIDQNHLSLTYSKKIYNSLIYFLN